MTVMQLKTQKRAVQCLLRVQRTESSVHQVSADSRKEHAELKSQLESKLTEKLGMLLMTGDKVEITTGTELTLPPETGWFPLDG